RRELPSPIPTELQRALEQYESRIVAFGNLHRCLVIGSISGCISAHYYVQHLCKALSKAVLEPIGVRCEVVVDAGDMPSEHCELLGLIIAELVTNAAKHAFRDSSRGLVRVALLKRVEAWLCVVSDNGDGMTAESPGGGSKIVEQLARALGGRCI